MKVEPKKIIKGLNKKAKVYLDDNNRLNELIVNTGIKIKNNNQLSDIVDEIKTLTSLVMDFSKKKYTNVSVSTIVTIIAGLIYLVNPVDIIPDIFIGGFVDDAAVLGYVLKRISTELDLYKKWKNG